MQALSERRGDRGVSLARMSFPEYFFINSSSSYSQHAWLADGPRYRRVGKTSANDKKYVPNLCTHRAHISMRCHGVNVARLARNYHLLIRLTTSVSAIVDSACFQTPIADAT